MNTCRFWMNVTTFPPLSLFCSFRETNWSLAYHLQLSFLTRLHNFRIRLLVGCNGVELDVSRFQNCPVRSAWCYMQVVPSGAWEPCPLYCQVPSSLWCHGMVTLIRSCNVSTYCKWVSVCAYSYGGYGYAYAPPANAPYGFQPLHRSRASARKSMFPIKPYLFYTPGAQLSSLSLNFGNQTTTASYFSLPM